MEKITGHKVNIDYEYQLFDIRPIPPKINQELEYLYFFANTSSVPMVSSVQYSQEYLDHIKDITNITPILTKSDQQAKNWWGALEDLALERKLNSKLTSFEVAKQLGIALDEGRIVTRPEEATEHISSYQAVTKWILKHPFLFSGKGFQIITADQKNFHWKAEQAQILEPYMDRTIDTGTIYDQGKVLHHLNLVDDKGAYKGSLCGKGKNNQIKIFSELEKNQELKKIIGSYLALGAKEIFSIDSFYYQKSGQQHFLPLIEVNYRKSLGYISHRLSDLFESELGLFLLFPAKHFNSKIGDYSKFQTQLASVVAPAKTYLLSPKGNYFSSFYFEADCWEELRGGVEQFVEYFKIPFLTWNKFVENFENSF